MYYAFLSIDNASMVQDETIKIWFLIDLPASAVIVRSISPEVLLTSMPWAWK